MDSEIIELATEDAQGQGPLPFDLHALRTCRYDDNRSTVFARHQGMLQKIYSFTTESGHELAFRRTKGLPFHGSTTHLIWISGFIDGERAVDVCIEPAYIFERTGCLLNPQIIEWNQVNLVPLIQICESAIHEAAQILNLRLDHFLPAHQLTAGSMDNHIALNFKQSNQLMILGLNQDLDHLEHSICNYCTQYWESHDWFAQHIWFKFDIFLRPVRRYWSTEDLAQVDVGDLLALQNLQAEDNARSLHAHITMSQNRTTTQHYEVFLNMNDQDTRLQFGKDDIHAPSDESPETSMAPHEEIELEIFAGHTRILFSDLCAIQEGSLLEIREHTLPAVTLRVMGEPILQGELVHFQDQIMIQVTRRVD